MMANVSPANVEEPEDGKCNDVPAETLWMIRERLEESAQLQTVKKKATNQRTNVTIQDEDLNDDQESVDSMLVDEVKGAIVIVTKESATCKVVRRFTGELQERTFFGALLVWKANDPKNKGHKESESVRSKVEDAELVSVGRFFVLSWRRQELLETCREGSFFARLMWIVKVHVGPDLSKEVSKNFEKVESSIRTAARKW